MQKPRIDGSFLGDGAHRAAYLTVSGLNSRERDKRQKRRVQTMMLRGSSLPPPQRQDSKQDRAWEDTGAAGMAGRESGKKQSLLLDKKVLS